MKQPKILFVDHTATLGGAELSLIDLAFAYRRSSQVLLFTDGILRPRLENLGVTVKLVEASQQILGLRTSGGLKALKTIPELWRIARQVATEAKGFDLIHANSQKAFIVAALATLQGSPPVVWHLRDIITAKHFSRLNRRIAVTLANQFATKVLVNSQATGKAFIAAGGKASLVSVVYNGFDSASFDCVSTQAIQQIRDSLAIGNKILVGLFSRLSYWKGQHILLLAIKQLPQVHVILVGDALFGEEEYVSYLKTLANEPELKERVHWLGFRDDIPTLMKACDIIAHTSTEPEPFGRVIVEGQLAQKPVIASAAGGALELIEDGKTGLLFPLGDQIALQQQIQKLIDDSAFADKIAHHGYISAKTNFSLETILNSFDRAIKTIDT
ncbi:glycosyl transferase group 1 [Stanieria cyanosphaera PCC 7437]|uniref:Glycosyl transferase group 1 n=1 Tax=Stanieria cyanosphaera (strain ATCC 29371 / PCC 7437) TaxID=111780 RepID=K9XP27_STAC7|nr:glycosyltransferase [Stanieria cyanosphaera]AFZ34365.1 glycosyl transferase group 1 [Stanieria cyanosphaera PCC 7437]